MCVWVKIGVKTAGTQSEEEDVQISFGGTEVEQPIPERFTSNLTSKWLPANVTAVYRDS